MQKTSFFSKLVLGAFIIIAFKAPSSLVGASESFYRAIHLVETGGRTGGILGDYNPKLKTYST
jgi:hypothetical protein